MATTTNYGWTTPDDTALVKDGAAAIRTLGSSVDTTTKALNPSTTLGDIEYRSSTANTNTRLGIGSTGQVLTVAAGVPSWATPAGGGMTLISEQVASSNSAIDFTSIPQTYKQLLLMYSGVYHTAAANVFGFKVNNTTSASLYSLQNSRITNTSASNSFDDASADEETLGYDATSTAINRTCSGYYLIDNYASTTKVKQIFRQLAWFRADVSQSILQHTNGFINTTSAITQLSIVRTTGSGNITNIANTSIRLYGLF